MSVNFGTPFWISLPIAVGVTLLAGMVVGTPSFRLEGAYLALVTLGLGESVRLFISATEYLGATNGFSGVPAPRIGEFRFDTYQKYYYLVMPVMLLGVFFSFQILRSRLGRAFMAVREDPVAAAASGVNVRRHKMIAFMISAAYAGFAGALYAHMIPGYLNPRNFTVIEMVTLLLMVVLGGLGHIWGGIIGAIIVTIVYDITKDYYHYSLLMFGMVIVLTVLFMPKGIGRDHRPLHRDAALHRDPRARGGEGEGRRGRVRGGGAGVRRCCLGPRTCRSISAGSAPSTGSTSPSRRARSAASSAPTVPARARSSTSSPGSTGPTRGAGCGSTGRRPRGRSRTRSRPAAWPARSSCCGCSRR